MEFLKESKLFASKLCRDELSHPRQAWLLPVWLSTGMTRGGTFWIEKGEIRHSTKNPRFTQNTLEALSNVLMISQGTRLHGGFFYAIRVPALCLECYAFTGATEF